MATFEQIFGAVPVGKDEMILILPHVARRLAVAEQEMKAAIKAVADFRPVETLPLRDVLGAYRGLKETERLAREAFRVLWEAVVSEGYVISRQDDGRMSVASVYC